MSKNPIGRPTKLTPETIRQLEAAFSIGATDIQACFIAGISKTALYNYQQDHPDFVDRKEALKSMVSYQAKKVLHDKIIEGDKQTAQWHLERTDEAYNPKKTADINLGGQPDNPVNNKLTIEIIPPGVK